MELRGRGVIVGVIDDGFDATHPALSGRIITAWDQNGTGAYGTPSPRNYGDILPAGETGVLTDTTGHGTHVAAIAAGGAPEADLVVVCHDASPEGLEAGIAWIFEVADHLDRPAVVNVSVGGVHADPHDGSDETSRVIDSLVGEGRLVCVAAGSEGRTTIHARVDVLPGQQSRIPIRWGGPADWASQARTVGLYGWCSGELPSTVAIVDDTESHGVVATGPGATEIGSVNNVGASVAIGHRGGRAAFNVELWPALGSFNTGSGARNILIPGRAVLILDGTGLSAPTRVDIWSRDACMSFKGAEEATADHMVASPACAPRVVTVGALYGDGEAMGRACDFSNRGPTVDGRQKPDVAAPGAEVRSARSRQKAAKASDGPSEDLMALSGTSMAAAAVTAMLALALEADPRLDPERACDLLKSAAGHQWDPALGWGEPDPAALVGLLERQ